MASSSGSTPLHLYLLGGARLSGEIPIARLEKKTAALVAFLALEGPTARTRIAGLLWPDSREATARNNLAQAIRRLKKAAGAVVVDGDAVLEIATTPVDVVALLDLVKKGSFAEAAALSGELLSGYDFDECPDFDAWLRATRIRVQHAWARAVTTQRDAAAAADDFDTAIALADALVAADPISEAAHLALARLHLARGDAPSAMAAYERCRKVLAKELAMKPSEAMLEVLRTIRDHKPAKKTRSLAPTPVQVLRPRWVGRDKEWALLARAADERKLVVIAGEPGVGKSRLARDFAETCGQVLLFEGRPGDPDVPFATVARGLRTIAFPRKDTLPEWARIEMARLVPSMVDHDHPPPSIHHKLRFLEAIAHVLELLGGDRHAIVLDDLQWFDDASAEVLLWAADRASRCDHPRALIGAHRAGELSAEVRRALEEKERSASATTLRLAPLPDAEMRALLASLEIETVVDNAAAIARICQGVPLYALEIARAMTDPDGGEEGAIPVPDRVRGLMRRRLERLGASALRLARIAAVAGAAFDVALAAFVLEAPSIDLVEPLAELEVAEVLVDGRFTHDLLAETTRDALPRAVREHLHARTAEHLARHGADPARIAQHFEAAGRDADAAPHLVRAADAARDLSRVRDAIAMYDRAARMFEAAGDFAGASVALYMRARSHVGGDADDVLARIERLAKTDADMARALCIRANVALEKGMLDEARAVAARALPLATSSGEAMVEAETIQVDLEVALRSGEATEAHVPLAAFAEVTQRAFSADREALAAVRFYEAELAALEDRHEDAIATFAGTIADLVSWGKHRHSQGGMHALIARSALARGDTTRAHAAMDESLACLQDAAGAQRAHATAWQARADLFLFARDHAGARAAITDLAGDAFEVRDVLAAEILAAEIDLELGGGDGAIDRLRVLATDTRADARARARAALVTTNRGALVSGPLDPEMVAIVTGAGGPVQQATLACQQGAIATSPEEAARCFAEARRVAEALSLPRLAARVDVFEALRCARRKKDHAAGRQRAIRAFEALDRGELGGLDAEALSAIGATIFGLRVVEAEEIVGRPTRQMSEIQRNTYFAGFPHRAPFDRRLLESTLQSSPSHRP